MAANSDNICKNCDKPVQVQIQKNTGFCCAFCEDEFKLKQETPKDQKKVAKKRAAKKSVNAVVE